MKSYSPSTPRNRSLVAGAAALALTLGLTGSAAAQGYGNLDIAVTNGTSHLSQQLPGGSSYFLLLAECNPAYQGGWYAPYAYAYKDGLNSAGWDLETLDIDSHNGLGTNTGLSLPAEPNSLTAFYDACLTDGQGNPADGVVRVMDPLFSVPYQAYGWSPYCVWNKTEFGMFSVSEVAQRAIWDRAQHMQQYSGMTAEEFFGSEAYYGMWIDGFKIAITLMGLRGQGVTGGHTLPPAWGLTDYPGYLPSPDISPQALISFAGTGSAGTPPLMFFNPVNPRTGNVQAPQRPIHLVAKGTEFHHKVENWERGMQVQLVCTNPMPGETATTIPCDMNWGGFGKMKITVPTNARAGRHTFRRYRYRLGFIGGQPVFGPWHSIGSEYRPILFVQ